MELTSRSVKLAGQCIGKLNDAELNDAERKIKQEKDAALKEQHEKNQDTYETHEGLRFEHNQLHQVIGSLRELGVICAFGSGMVVQVLIELNQLRLNPLHLLRTLGDFRRCHSIPFSVCLFL